MHPKILHSELNFFTEGECLRIIENKYDLELLKNKILNSIKTHFISDYKGYVLNDVVDIKLNSYKPNQKYENFKKIENGFISFMIQLNDEYDEGFFQFSVKDDTYYYQLQPGTGHMVLFFSNLNHRVIPVKRGIKYTLTGTVNLKEKVNYKKTII
jgi:predicted 2-oxoglutarate/Fe(II)-dependent dioxygenase YbiX